METKFQEAIKDMKSFLENEAKTETIIGKEFKLGEFNCVPVISVGLGFGGGSGEIQQSKLGQGGTEGVAGGVGMTPIGFLVAHGEHIQFISTKPATGLSSALEKLPELLTKYFETHKTSVS